MLSKISLSGQNKILIRGNARLVVDQDVSLSGQSFIQINTNASLDLHVKKGSVSLSGNGVANLTGNAANFSLFGLPDMKDISISGNGALIGTIYAPQAKLSLSGGGNDTLDPSAPSSSTKSMAAANSSSTTTKPSVPAAAKISSSPRGRKSEPEGLTSLNGSQRRM